MAIAAPRSLGWTMSRKTHRGWSTSRQRALLPTVALAAVAWWGVPGIARACSCRPPGTPMAAATEARAVFEGRTFAVDHRSGKSVYRFEVSRVWKGDVGADVDVQTAVSSSLCGRTFESGTSYVVYAYAADGGGLGDNICSRTRTSSSATEDLVSLGPGSPPLGAHAEAPTTTADVEPPRIEASPPPTSPNARGCAIAPSSDSRLPWLTVLLLVIGRRRPTKDSA